VEKYCPARQAFDNNMTHAGHLRLKHTHTLLFPLQQKLQKCTLMLHYRYNACLVHENFINVVMQNNVHTNQAQ
jgi:hypothetical protein